LFGPKRIGNEQRPSIIGLNARLARSGDPCVSPALISDFHWLWGAQIPS